MVPDHSAIVSVPEILAFLRCSRVYLVCFKQQTLYFRLFLSASGFLCLCPVPIAEQRNFHGRNLRQLGRLTKITCCWWAIVSFPGNISRFSLYTTHCQTIPEYSSCVSSIGIADCFAAFFIYLFFINSVRIGDWFIPQICKKIWKNIYIFLSLCRDKLNTAN